jgi:capsular polysaccharide biosynthesis protein
MTIFAPFKAVQIAFFARLRLGVYTKSIPESIAKSKEILNWTPFKNSNNLQARSPYFYKPWISDLKKCHKNGGYRTLFGKFYWSHRKLQYFNFKNNTYGGIPEVITEVLLCKLSNIKYTPNAIRHNDVSKYTFKVQKNASIKYDFEDAIAFNFGGANFFQHFVQDCLPVIASAKDFLETHSEITLLLPKPHKNFVSRNELISMLGITNSIFDTEHKPLLIKNLYYFDFKPFPAKYALPTVYYKKLNQELKLNVEEQNKVVLITRNERTRNIKNIDQVMLFLENFSRSNNLDLVVINSSTATFFDYQSNLASAKVIISMHGGACLNLMFANTDAVFFEFLPISGTDSTIDFVRKMGILAVPVPLDFVKNQTDPITISHKTLTEIEKIYNEINLK